MRWIAFGICVGLSVGAMLNLVQAKPPSTDKDGLAQTQKILADSMAANNIRLRVAAENMANHKTADYAPRSVEVKTKNDRKAKTKTVQVNKVIEDSSKMTKVYDPTHPKADADGMVNMPKLDPLLTMMDMQKAKLDSERAMKAMQMTTDMRHRTISMMKQ